MYKSTFNIELVNRKVIFYLLTLFCEYYICSSIMSINKKILKYLEEKGINHSVLVKKTGISKQNLSRILGSSDDLKVSQLVEICKALDVPNTFFFEGKENDSNKEIEDLKSANLALQKKVNFFADKYEEESNGTVNLFKLIEAAFSDDEKKSEEYKNILRVLVKYRNGELPQSPPGTTIF